MAPPKLRLEPGFDYGCQRIAINEEHLPHALPNRSVQTRRSP